MNINRIALPTQITFKSIPSTSPISHSIRKQNRNEPGLSHISQFHVFKKTYEPRSNHTLQGPSTHVSQALKCFIFIWSFLLTLPKRVAAIEDHIGEQPIFYIKIFII